jgi:NADH dehydrogenase (ubiquinone) 1 beta subcomplex subunit 8
MMNMQLHEREELYSMWGPDIPVVPPQRAAIHFAIAVAGFIGFGYATKHYLVAEKPAVPREYPFSGLVTELGGLEENKVRIIFFYFQCSRG